MRKAFHIILPFPIKYCEYPSIKCLFSLTYSCRMVKAVVTFKHLVLPETDERRVEDKKKIIFLEVK